MHKATFLKMKEVAESSFRLDAFPNVELAIFEFYGLVPGHVIETGRKSAGVAFAFHLGDGIGRRSPAEEGREALRRAGDFEPGVFLARVCLAVYYVRSRLIHLIQVQMQPDGTGI